MASPAIARQNTAPAAPSLRQARAIAQPEARVAALEAFLAQQPDASDANTARALLLETLLASFPQRTDAIHTVATALRSASAPGLERWLAESRLALELAEASEHGADLPDATLWAHDAVQSMTELAYRRAAQAMAAQAHLPPAAARALHAQFAADRAHTLVALGRTEVETGDLAGAARALAAAVQLGPATGERLVLQAQLALARHEPQPALTALIQASALTRLPPRWQAQRDQLFITQEGESATQAGKSGTALESPIEVQIDLAYRKLHPALFTLPPQPVPASGHPALLELFTGSDCAPCTAPDLALDSLLTSFDLSELLVLAFDEHIPRPDPLATPATVERADLYGVGSTPEAFLDGAPVPLLGSTRADVENVVLGLAEAITDAAALPSAFELTIRPEHPSAAHTVGASVSLARRPALVPGQPSTGEASLPVLARAVLFTALVEDNLRYMGQNGVRFHRMVVRALRQDRAGTLLAPGAPSLRAAWDLPTLEREQTAYLTHFAQTNDQFGSFTFATTDLPIAAEHLYVLSWLQDPVTHRVLQSAYTAVPPS